MNWEKFEPPQSALLASICRCPPGKHGTPGYGSTSSYSDSSPSSKPTPGTSYEILRAEQVGNHLVMQVLYTCGYEGLKTMVFLSANALSALHWRKIDPHFPASTNPQPRGKGEAPYPDARFPSTEKGWKDAIAWAKTQP